MIMTAESVSPVGVHIAGNFQNPAGLDLPGAGVGGEWNGDEADDGYHRPLTLLGVC